MSNTEQAKINQKQVMDRIIVALSHEQLSGAARDREFRRFCNDLAVPAEMLEPSKSPVAQERLIEESFRRRLGVTDADEEA